MSGFFIRRHPRALKALRCPKIKSRLTATSLEELTDLADRNLEKPFWMEGHCGKILNQLIKKRVSTVRLKAAVLNQSTSRRALFKKYRDLQQGQEKEGNHAKQILFLMTDKNFKAALNQNSRNHLQIMSRGPCKRLSNVWPCLELSLAVTKFNKFSWLGACLKRKVREEYLQWTLSKSIQNCLLS